MILQREGGRVVVVLDRRDAAAAALAVVLLLIVTGIFWAGRLMRASRQQADADSVAWYAAPRFDVSTADRPYLGAPDAPVTIVEFTDYLCPFCRRYATETLPAVLAAHGGRVRYVVRNFPVQPVNELALPAAEAVECAYRQGRFWEYRGAVFGDAAPLTRGRLRALAAAAGLDTAAFNRCVRERATRAVVEHDLLDAWGYGVSGTPTFFVNGRRFRGLRSLDQLEHLVQYAARER